MARRKSGATSPHPIARGDVCFGYTGSSSGGNASARVSRAVGLTSCTVTATHLPTGVSVVGEIPKGHYTKKQMQALRSTMEERLLAQLCDVVAGHLRAPGR